MERITADSAAPQLALDRTRAAKNGRLLIGRLRALTFTTALLVMLVCGAGFTAVATAGTFPVSWSCPADGGTAGVFQPFTVPGINTNIYCGSSGPSGLVIRTATRVSAGQHGNWQANAPSGISIVGASLSGVIADGVNQGVGWGGGYYWSSGGVLENERLPTHTWSFAPSPWWGFWIICGWSSCDGSLQPAGIAVANVTLTAEENTGPAMAAIGSNNLWYQGGHWVRGVFPSSIYATDPSGVCAMQETVNNGLLLGPAAAPNPTVWHQCPDQTWTESVNTASYGQGAMPFAVYARNAAGVSTSPTETIYVDNQAPGIALSAPNDQSVWIGHGVSVSATASAGPSGVSGISCDGIWHPGVSSQQVTVDGDGIHRVTCSGANNALDVNNTPASSPSQTWTVKIDEAPPSVAFEPQNPSAPLQLIADTADGESGVASGTVQMRPAGSSQWQSLPTQFDGRHLLATLNDAGLSGPYQLQATSCDQVGNCASSTETLTLPVRLASVSSVSFQRINDPVTTHRVRERVRVGWHWETVRNHGKLVQVKRGGRWRTITVIRVDEHCSYQRVHVGEQLWREQKVCHPPHIVVTGSARVDHGRPATIHGLLTSAQGVPLAGERVRILTAPDNGLSQFNHVTTVGVGADGTWTATLPPGPSRLIQAVYDGSQTMLPATGQASLTVPASVRLLSVSPRRVAWGGTVSLSGRLLGGYLPPAGALVRLRIGSGSAYTTFGVKEHVAGDGQFSTTYTFGVAPSSVQQVYWFEIASLPTGDYPFAPANSRRVEVTVGGAP